MNQVTKEIFSKLKIIIIVFALTVGASYVSANWSAPGSTPPTCPAGQPGCDAPLNVGSTDQVKNAGLSLNTLSVVGASDFGGLAIFNGSLRIPCTPSCNNKILTSTTNSGTVGWATMQQTTVEVQNNGTQEAIASCPSGYTRTGCSGGRTQGNQDFTSIKIKPSGNNGCEASVGPDFPSNLDKTVYAYCLKID